MTERNTGGGYWDRRARKPRPAAPPPESQVVREFVTLPVTIPERKGLGTLRVWTGGSWCQGADEWQHEVFLEGRRVFGHKDLREVQMFQEELSARLHAIGYEVQLGTGETWGPRESR